MRCRSGDLCRITVGVNIDKLIRVTVPHFDPEGVSWEYEGPKLDSTESDGTRSPDYEQVTFWDHVLQPIRDQPGADETLTWKAVPKPLSVVEELEQIRKDLA